MNNIKNNLIRKLILQEIKNFENEFFKYTLNEQVAAFAKAGTNALPFAKRIWNLVRGPVVEMTTEGRLLQSFVKRLEEAPPTGLRLTEQEAQAQLEPFKELGITASSFPKVRAMYTITYSDLLDKITSKFYPQAQRFTDIPLDSQQFIQMLLHGEEYGLSREFITRVIRDELGLTSSTIPQARKAYDPSLRGTYFEKRRWFSPMKYLISDYTIPTYLEKPLELLSLDIIRDPASFKSPVDVFIRLSRYVRYPNWEDLPTNIRELIIDCEKSGGYMLTKEESRATQEAVTHMRNLGKMVNMSFIELEGALASASKTFMASVGKETSKNMRFLADIVREWYSDWWFSTSGFLAANEAKNFWQKILAAPIFKIAVFFSSPLWFPKLENQFYKLNGWIFGASEETAGLEGKDANFILLENFAHSFLSIKNVFRFLGSTGFAGFDFLNWAFYKFGVVQRWSFQYSGDTSYYYKGVQARAQLIEEISAGEQGIISDEAMAGLNNEISALKETIKAGAEEIKKRADQTQREVRDAANDLKNRSPMSGTGGEETIPDPPPAAPAEGEASPPPASSSPPPKRRINTDAGVKDTIIVPDAGVKDTIIVPENKNFFRKNNKKITLLFGNK